MLLRPAPHFHLRSPQVCPGCATLWNQQGRWPASTSDLEKGGERRFGCYRKTGHSRKTNSRGSCVYFCPPTPAVLHFPALTVCAVDYWRRPSFSPGDSLTSPVASQPFPPLALGCRQSPNPPCSLARGGSLLCWLPSPPLSWLFISLTSLLLPELIFLPPLKITAH